MNYLLIFLVFWVLCGIAVFIFSIVEDIYTRKEVVVADIIVSILLGCLGPLALVGGIAKILDHIKQHPSYEKFIHYRVYKMK